MNERAIWGALRAVKRYELEIEGRILRDLDEADITEMHRYGRVGRRTRCRPMGAAVWGEVNDYFPLLKYGVATGDVCVPAGAIRRSGGWRGRKWSVGVLCFLLASLVAIAGFQISYRGSRTSSVAKLQNRSRSEDWPKLRERSPQEGVRTVALHSSPAPRARYVKPLATEKPSRTVEVQSARTVQYVPPAQRPVVPKKAPAPEEFTIPLGMWNTVRSSYGSFSVKVIDHGPVTFTVSINGGRGRRLEKEKGFETTGTNIALIHSLGRAKVYYVDRIGVSLGHCVLKVIPDR